MWKMVPVTIAMNPAPLPGQTPPPTQTIDAFSASSTAIKQGDSVTLSWSTSNASAVRLNGASVSANGSQSASPTADAVYTLEADGSAATIKQTLTVSVAQPTTEPPVSAPTIDDVLDSIATLQATAQAFKAASTAPPPTTPPPTGTGSGVALVGSNVLNDLDPDPLRKMVEAGNMGQAGVVSNGAMAFAPKFGAKGAIVLSGGGHGDYGGNEGYAFDLALAKWIRLSDPLGIDPTNPLNPTTTTDPRIDLTHGELPDGSAMACHGFNIFAVVPGGTNNAGLLLRISGPSLGYGTGGASAPWVHVFDLGVTPIAKPTDVWKRHSLNSCTVNAASSVSTPSFHTYDEQVGIVWGGYAGGFHSLLTKYDIAARTYTMIPNVASSNWGYMPQACAHPVRNLLLYIAGYGGYNQPQQLKLMAVDLANPSRGAITLNMTGDLVPTAGLSVYNAYMAPWGFDWDTVHDCGYICCGDDDRSSVYRVQAPANPLTDAWTFTKVALPSPLPALAPGGGDSALDATYGHWRFCPSIASFAFLTTTRQKLALFTP